jgi:hypothetical protein
MAIAAAFASGIATGQCTFSRMEQGWKPPVSWAVRRREAQLFQRKGTRQITNRMARRSR